jgi:hypothetical protein
MRRFTKEEDQYLTDNYLIFSSHELERQLDRPHGTVRQRYKLLGLIVPYSLKERFKNESCFQKGVKPFNAGIPRVSWMSSKGIKKVSQSQYKPGNLPWHTHKSNEVVKWQKPGEKPYLIIYIKPTVRKYLHRHIWEQTNGRIPKGQKIVFKDGNTLNCNLDNLEIVSDSEMMKRNSAQRFGPEIFKIIQLRGALNRQINKRLKQLSNEK